MHKDPLVSVILLTYNSAKYIGRALSSVHMQCYKNIEVIVVDAGSVDSSESIVKSFSGTKWLELPKSDMGMARNFGLDHSNGSYVMFLDSDDIYLEGKISNQVRSLNDDKSLDFVVSPAYVMRSSRDNVGIKSWTTGKIDIGSFFQGQCYSLATLCIRVSALTEKCRFYEQDAGRYCEDWSFQFRLLLDGLRFEVMPLPSVLVELREDSHTDWSCQPKMKSVGLEVVKSALTIIEGSDMDHGISEQSILDNYRLKLAISYFTNGQIIQGRLVIDQISGNLAHYKITLITLSYLIPKFLVISLLRNLWMKRQNSSFEWIVTPVKIKAWLDKHNEHLNY